MQTTAITASPFSYSKVCDTFRPRGGQTPALRTDLGGKSFVHFQKYLLTRNRFVVQHRPEGRPARIEDTFRHAGLGESCGGYISDRHESKLPHDAGREFVLKVFAAIRNLAVDVANQPLLVCALGLTELRFQLAVFAGRRGGEGGRARWAAES